MQRTHEMQWRMGGVGFLLVTLGLGCGGGDKAEQDVVQDLRASDQADQSHPLDLSDVNADSVDLPEPDLLWQEGPQPLETAQWVKDRAWLLDVSPWSTLWEKTPGDQPDLWDFSDLGIGNGVSFSMIGYKAPFNRLHSMIGPGYDRKGLFFSDTWLEVQKADGSAYNWTREWMGRPTKTGIVRTEAQSNDVGLSTVDMAPQATTPSEPLGRAILRTAVVRNRSESTLTGLSLVVRCAGQQSVTELGYMEQPEQKMRTITLLSGGVANKGSEELTIALPDLAPGAEQVVELAYIMGNSQTEMQATHEALLATTMPTLLEQTRDWWTQRLSQGTQLVTPDPMVNGYIESQLVVMLSQTTFGGAVCPMSNYTHSWIRDTSGPVRFFLSLGRYEEVRRNLDFLFVGHVRHSEISDILQADMDPSGELPAQPDWQSLAPGDDHMIAETPCHLPLMHYWYYLASGNLDFMPQRLEWMRYAMNMQHITDGLLPFGGDETYRAAMAVAFDLSLTEEFFTGYYSSYSSFLWIVGAEALEKLAEAAGVGGQVEDVMAKVPAVQEAMDETFLRTDGAYLPYVHEAGLEPAPGLYEDVSLQPTWLGLFDPDDEKANTNLQVSIQEIGGEDGYLVTPLPESYKMFMGLPLTKGMYTGMNPGHYLWALSAAEHPLAEKVFNTMREHATDTGTSPEYQLLDHFDPLHLSFSETGKEPADYTARYRPWEGGINGEAVVQYLLGQEPDAANKRLRLTPHLPNGWGWLEAKGIRVGNTTFDLRMERPEATHWFLRLTHVSGEELTLSLRLPWVGETLPTVKVNGAVVEAEMTTTFWQTHRVVIADVPLPVGEVAEVEVK